MRWSRPANVCLLAAWITAFLLAPLAHAAAVPDRTVIDELVLLNRILASKEMNLLGAYGHVSLRSRSNPNRYFFADNIAPALVSAKDIYESDLDNQPVAGARGNLIDERFLHGEIYKARPEVMAVVLLSTPELVAFSVSSTALNRNNRQVPVADLRKIENGQNGALNTAALGCAVAQSLGRADAALILGHGAVIATSASTNLVSAALNLQATAEQRFFELGLGGTFTHMNFTRDKAIPEAGGSANLGPSGSVERIDRFTAFFNYLGARDLARPRVTRAVAELSSDQALIQDLVIANRLLVAPELGVLTPDGLAHISARSHSHPDHFLIARDYSPGMVTAADIIENDLDTKPVKNLRVPQYSERYIHAEIYRARPDVMAVLHAHTPELKTFASSSVKLRPVSNRALFIGDGFPVYDLTKFTGGAPSPVGCTHCISTPELGRALAKTMGSAPVSLLLDHGIAMADTTSVRSLVSRAYNLRQTARIQQMAASLGGSVNAFEPSAVVVNAKASSTLPEWDYWKESVLGATNLNYVPKPTKGALPPRVR